MAAQCVRDDIHLLKLPTFGIKFPKLMSVLLIYDLVCARDNINHKRPGPSREHTFHMFYIRDGLTLFLTI
jgi:hypothetical protein